MQPGPDSALHASSSFAAAVCSVFNLHNAELNAQRLDSMNKLASADVERAQLSSLLETTRQQASRAAERLKVALAAATTRAEEAEARAEQYARRLRKCQAELEKHMDRNKSSQMGPAGPDESSPTTVDKKLFKENDRLHREMAQLSESHATEKATLHALYERSKQSLAAMQREMEHKTKQWNAYKAAVEQQKLSHLLSVKENKHLDGTPIKQPDPATVHVSPPPGSSRDGRAAAVLAPRSTNQSWTPTESVSVPNRRKGYESDNDATTTRPLAKRHRSESESPSHLNQAATVSSTSRTSLPPRHIKDADPKANYRHSSLTFPSPQDRPATTPTRREPMHDFSPTLAESLMTIDDDDPCSLGFERGEGYKDPADVGLSAMMSLPRDADCNDSDGELMTVTGIPRMASEPAPPQHQPPARIPHQTVLRARTPSLDKTVNPTTTTAPLNHTTQKISRDLLAHSSPPSPAPLPPPFVSTLTDLTLPSPLRRGKPVVPSNSNTPTTTPAAESPLYFNPASATGRPQRKLPTAVIGHAARGAKPVDRSGGAAAAAAGTITPAKSAKHSKTKTPKSGNGRVAKTASGKSQRKHGTASSSSSVAAAAAAAAASAASSTAATPTPAKQTRPPKVIHIFSSDPDPIVTTTTTTIATTTSINPTATITNIPTATAFATGNTPFSSLLEPSSLESVLPPPPPTTTTTATEHEAEPLTSPAGAGGAEAAAVPPPTTTTAKRTPVPYKYHEVVRNKELRKKMHAEDCPCCTGVSELQCACVRASNTKLTQKTKHPLPRLPLSHSKSHTPPQFYKAAGPIHPLPELGAAPTDSSHDAIQSRIQHVSRHRYVHKPPATPPGYWDVDFPTTQQALELGKKTARERH
ncbi:hypothetical protein DFJ77DRAFT_480917, partial [Powellomyces hirtus]